MPQKLSVNNLSGWKTLLNLMKIWWSYDEESDEGYLLQVDDQYLEKLNELHNDLLFFPERLKIEGVERLAANLHDKTEYVIDIRNLKQALNHGLVFKNVHKVIKFNQNAWLKPYFDVNTD